MDNLLKPTPTRKRDVAEPTDQANVTPHALKEENTTNLKDCCLVGLRFLLAGYKNTPLRGNCFPTNPLTG